jgi:hypothetical protein
MASVLYSELRFVKRHRGTMPIILTSPHDGIGEPEGVDAREEEQTPANCGPFRTGRDRDSSLVAEGVAQRILDETGLSPYVVIARFHRRFIDANREARCAFTDPDAQPFYDEYHTRIQTYVDQVLAQNADRGFLFDIHGTGGVASDPAEIYLGTADGATLRPHFDRDRLFFRHGLHGLLRAVQVQTSKGPVSRYTVSPANASATETGEVNGGFTVRHYGQQINSVQIELLTELRTDATQRALLIEDLAFAMINFVRRYAAF